jgi:hypothetical protein
MTHGFEQQAPLGNQAFTRSAPTPHQVGVKLVEAPQDSKTDRKRPPEPRAH